jgi:hypothetical protein
MSVHLLKASNLLLKELFVPGKSEYPYHVHSSLLMELV